MQIVMRSAIDCEHSSGTLQGVTHHAKTDRPLPEAQDSCHICNFLPARCSTKGLPINQSRGWLFPWAQAVCVVQVGCVLLNKKMCARETILLVKPAEGRAPDRAQAAALRHICRAELPHQHPKAEHVCLLVAGEAQQDLPHNNIYIRDMHEAKPWPVLSCTDTRAAAAWSTARASGEYSISGSAIREELTSGAAQAKVPMSPGKRNPTSDADSFRPRLCVQGSPSGMQVSRESHCSASSHS